MMFMKLESGSMPKPEWIDDMGNYNRMPQPFRPVTIHRFLRYCGVYNPQGIEKRLIFLGGGNLKSENVTILWFHDRALAFVHPQSWKPTPDGIHYDLSECKFYEIGCEHEMRELHPQDCRERKIPHYGNCWHVTECLKCGHLHSYDSSG